MLKNRTGSFQEETNLKEEFEALKSQKIPEGTHKKILNIKRVSSCGCGSSAVNYYHAIVPEDYDRYNDRDIVDSEDLYNIQKVAGRVFEGKYYGSVEKHNPYDYHLW